MREEDPGARSLCRKGAPAGRGAGRRPRECSPQGGVFKPVPAVGNSSPGPDRTLEKVKNTPSVGWEGAGLFHRLGKDCLLHRVSCPSLGAGPQVTGQHEGEASEVSRAYTSVRHSLSGSCSRARRLLECCTLGASLAHPSPGAGCQTACWFQTPGGEAVGCGWDAC